MLLRFQQPLACAAQIYDPVPLRVTTLYDCTAPLTRVGPPMDVFDVVTIPIALVLTLVDCCRFISGSTRVNVTVRRSGTVSVRTVTSVPTGDFVVLISLFLKVRVFRPSCSVNNGWPAMLVVE